MKFTTTLVFFFMFLVVLGFYLYMDPQAPFVLNAPEMASDRLMSLEKGDTIVWILIERKGQEEKIVVELQGGEWMLTSPITNPADPLMMNGLTTGLRISKKARRFVRDKDWDEYGLREPALKIGVKTKRGMTQRVLHFGDPSPVGDRMYARWEGEEEYFLLDANLQRAFDRSVYSLRQKRIFQIPPEKVTKIYIRAAEANYELSKSRDTWFWLEPISILGDTVSAQKVKEILVPLQGLYVKEFLDVKAKKERDKMGFTLLGSSIKIWGEDGQTEILYLGQHIKNRDAFYGNMEESDAYFLVARDNVQTLFKTLEGAVKQLGKSQLSAPV